MARILETACKRVDERLEIGVASKVDALCRNTVRNHRGSRTLDDALRRSRLMPTAGAVYLRDRRRRYLRHDGIVLADGSRPSCVKPVPVPVRRSGDKRLLE